MELLSIIVPVYNGEKHIDECIKSLTTQNYNNVQIICVNDGSTDRSNQLLEKWVQVDSRVEVYFQNNSGVSVARNTGLLYAKGDYITFVDCDDTVESNMYTEMMNQFYDDAVGMVHCSYNKVPLEGEKYCVGGSGKITRVSGNEMQECLIKGIRFTGSPCTKIYKKNNIRDVIFDRSLKINEDVWFNYSVLDNIKDTIFIDCGFYNYFEWKSGATKTTEDKKIVDDCVKVAKYIYKEQSGKKLEKVARNKYFMALCNQYRAYLYASREREQIANVIDELLSLGVSVDNKYIYNYKAMRLVPWIYKRGYKIYDKIRKPNWDV